MGMDFIKVFLDLTIISVKENESKILLMLKFIGILFLVFRTNKIYIIVLKINYELNNID